MSGLIAGQTGIFIPFAAKQAQQTILGLQWWIWLIILAIVAILIWLLFRQPKQEVQPFIEKEKIVPPHVEESIQADDLTIIEGIGPKINAVLREAGIDTYQKLSDAAPEHIGKILKSAGIRLFDPTTWGEQASLAAVGHWDELKALQDRLKGGRSV